MQEILYTPFDGLIQISKQFLKSLALGGAAGYGGNFRPIAAFFCFVNYDFQLHGLIILSAAARGEHLTPGITRRAHNVMSDKSCG